MSFFVFVFESLDPPITCNLQAQIEMNIFHHTPFTLMIRVGFGLQESRLVTAFRQGPSVPSRVSPPNIHLLPPSISIWLYGLVSGPESLGLLLACRPFLFPSVIGGIMRLCATLLFSKTLPG